MLQSNTLESSSLVADVGNKEFDDIVPVVYPTLNDFLSARLLQNERTDRLIDCHPHGRVDSMRLRYCYEAIAYVFRVIEEAAD